MRVIKYNSCTRVNYGTEEEPQFEEIFSVVTMTYSEANEEIAKREAYNGEYTIKDDGEPEPEVTPTQLDRVESQVAYLAMMTGYADILTT